MTDEAKRLLAEVLKLDADDRELLLLDIEASLELSPEEQEAHDAAWVDEIDRRIDDAIAHPEDNVDAFEFLDQLRAMRSKAV